MTTSSTSQHAPAAAAPLSSDERLRYARHLILPEVGPAGQQRLKAGRVLVVGAGGLGSPVATYLAAAGVGTLGIVDFDAVDSSNLQRQTLYGTADVGRAKIDAARDRIAELNPHVRVEAYALRLTSQNALEILQDYDVVIDGSDNFPTRYLVNDACVILRKPNVYGSIFRFEGQNSVFAVEGGPCYRCLFAEPPPPGLVPSCAEAGVLGVLPAIIGSIQAVEAIKLLLGVGETLVGRLLAFDALRLRFRELKLRRDPDCPVCGTQPRIRELIDYDRFCGTAAAAETAEMSEAAPEITATELKQRIDRGDDLEIIDVREPYEWEIGNLEAHGARLIPLAELPERLDEIAPAAEFVLVCRTGSRSGRAVAFLRQQGYANVHNLRGGLMAWADEVDPAMPKY